MALANDYNLSRLLKKDVAKCAKRLGFALDEFVNGKNEVPDEKPGLIDSEEKQFIVDENSANGNEVSSKKFIDDNDSDTDSMVGVQDHCSSEASGFDYIETRFVKLVLPQETNLVSMEILLSTHDKDQSVGFMSMLEQDGDDGAGRKDSNNCNFNPQQNVFELTQNLYNEYEDLKKENEESSFPSSSELVLTKDSYPVGFTMLENAGDGMPVLCFRNNFKLMQKLFHEEDSNYFERAANQLQECFNKRHPTNTDCICPFRQNYIESHINEVLATTPFKWTDEQYLCVKLLCFHTTLCDFGDNCKVPYCKDLRCMFEDNSILELSAGDVNDVKPIIQIVKLFTEREEFKNYWDKEPI